MLQIVPAVAAALVAATVPPGAYVPVYGQPVPNYFSSTNCRANGTVSASGAHYFTRAQLLINGNVVKEWTRPLGEPVANAKWVSLGVMFDSTSQLVGSSAQVTVQGWDETGAMLTKSKTTPVVNQAAVFGRFDLEIQPIAWDSEHGNPGTWIVGDATWQGCPVTASSLTSAGYTLWSGHPITALGWNYDDLLTAVPACSVLYVNTHGGQEPGYGQVFFQTDSDDGWYARPNQPISRDQMVGAGSPQGGVIIPIRPTRLAANGTGVPPCNTGAPPMNFVWIDGCEAAYQDSAMRCTFPEAFLFPQTNVYNPNATENQ